MSGPDSRLTQLFQRASAMEGEELERFLAGLRSEDPAVAAELMELLEFAARSGAFGSDARADVASIFPKAQPSSTAELVANLAKLSPPPARYRLEGKVGAGGMGAILRVWDTALHRPLAMKVVLGQEVPQREGPTPPVDEQKLGRFLEEAQVTGQLDHPGVVPVHELAVNGDGTVYFTMRLVKGASLDAIFALAQKGEDGWNQTRALSTLLKVCETMSYAHSRGVIHRDLKPANVMVGKYGEVYVMDWGLAKVRGRKDEHDLRLAPASSVQVFSERSEERGVRPDSPILTMDGTVTGTPSYMPPEQAEGRVEELGPRSDVYGVGAMLYELLTGTAPYVSTGARIEPRVILAMINQGPPKPLHALAPHVPAELQAICEKAMARRIEDRYADMQALAEDLRAYLERRVVRAYETGAVAELRKWVLRNKPLATALAAGVLVLITGLSVALALREVAEVRGAEVLRLSALQELDDLKTSALKLWPPSPEKLTALELWLTRARKLVDERPQHESTLQMLRQKALPQSDAERESQRSAHPRFGEYQLLSAKLDALRKAREVREVKRQAEVVTIGDADVPSEAGSDALTLNFMAYPLTNPERRIFGQEAIGVALARLALERAKSKRVGAMSANTLAMGLYAQGLDEEALAKCALSLELAAALNDPTFQRSYDSLKGALPTALEDGSASIEAVTAELVALDLEISKDLSWSFGDEQNAWWHAQLVKLIQDLEAFADPESGSIDGVSPQQGWGVQRRRDFAATLEEKSVTGDEARRRWDAAIAEIANPGQSPLYGGLLIQPQIGLLPLGRDPNSGLWEFAHLQTGEPAVREADGTLQIGEETGLVFVLLPGGTFHLGCQKDDPGKPNYDRAAMDDEGPVRTVELSPFFLSKYELTQAIWLRASGDVPSDGVRGGWDPKWSEVPPTLLHPANRLSWDECRIFLERNELVFPSEAQWEYAARGGTETPWYFGTDPADLEGLENIYDAYAGDHGGANGRSPLPWADGYTGHAPVGTFAANPFGLHDVLGNLSEYCRDGYVNSYILIYGKDLSKDRFVSQEISTERTVRGGSYQSSVPEIRCAYRLVCKTDVRRKEFGLRPARILKR